MRAGRAFEAATLAACRLKDQFEYKTYSAAVAEVKANQPWNPSEPSVRWASDLHARTAMALGLEDWSGLRFYTAIGTALDRFHGVDGFFEFCGVRVTLDVTLNAAKFGGYKADFIVGPTSLTMASAGRELALRIAAELLKRQEAFAKQRPPHRAVLARIGPRD